jgi:hypothetical protein
MDQRLCEASRKPLPCQAHGFGYCQGVFAPVAIYCTKLIPEFDTHLNGKPHHMLHNEYAGGDAWNRLLVICSMPLMLIMILTILCKSVSLLIC